jgi:hypothetical protein
MGLLGGRLLHQFLKRPDAMGLNTAPGLATPHLTGRAMTEYIIAKKLSGIPPCRS